MICTRGPPKRVGVFCRVPSHLIVLFVLFVSCFRSMEGMYKGITSYTGYGSHPSLYKSVSSDVGWRSERLLLCIYKFHQVFLLNCHMT